jgi:hypothetical protein
MENRKSMEENHFLGLQEAQGEKGKRLMRTGVAMIAERDYKAWVRA